MKQISYKHILFSGLIVGAGAGQGVLAEGQTPAVFYGKFNLSLDQLDVEGASNLIQGKAASQSEQWELNSNASRLGVKGEQALADSGLSVFYQAEYETNVDDGSNGDTAFSQRNTFAGLRGSFGEVRLGKFDTPLKTAEGKVDQFNDLRADLDVLIGGQNRANNIVQYTSPALAKSITLNAAFIPGEGSDTDLDGSADQHLADTVSLSAVLDKKPFYLALAYDQHQAARRSIDGIVRGELLRLVGGWSNGQVELGALLEQVSDDASNSQKQDTSYLLSGAFKAGKFKYKAQYGLSQGKVSDEQGQLLALGLDYSLAAQSSLYAYWTSLDLDQAERSDNSLGLGFTYSF